MSGKKSRRAELLAAGGLFDMLNRAGIMGLHLVSGVLVGLGIGYFLDRWFETGPWLTAGFLILGILAGFMNLWIDAKRLIRQQEEHENKRLPRR